MPEPEEINLLLPLFLILVLGGLAAILGILYWLAKRLNFIAASRYPQSAGLVKAVGFTVVGVVVASILFKLIPMIAETVSKFFR